jgi:hypothetical protein
MASKSVVNVTELDFDKIKESIKTYISNQGDFKDYNFEGSVMNLLLDILAYNSYQNAFFTNMIGNEMFLDSAQLRDSVVSRAKMLDYIPTSVKSATTRMIVTYDDESDADSINLPEGSVFSVTAESGETFEFVTNNSYNFYKALNYVETIDVYQGVRTQQTFAVNDVNPVKYILNNENIDLDSLKVELTQFVGSSNTEIYTKADNIENVKSDSSVYFLQEVSGQQYELYFGDDSLGKKPQNGNIIKVNYIVSSGEVANEIREISDWTSENNNVTINSVLERTYGGAEVETIESIKFNAPRNYESQNRAVLAEDYRRILLRDFPQLINSVRIWGGEDNIPPVYGKVFLSVQPKGSATLLSTNQKEDLRKNLKKYNVMTNEVEFINPSYNYIIPDITVYYDSNKTSLNSGQIAEKISTTVKNFETTYLGNFENKYFRYSQFSRLIDLTDSSIVYSDTKIRLQKRFSPLLNVSTKYTINFSTTLQNLFGESSISSSSFTLNNRVSFFDDDSNGNVRTFYFDQSNQKIYTNNTFGTIDYSSGIMSLSDFNPSFVNNNEIIISAAPTDSNLVTERYIIMLLSDTIVRVEDTRNKEITSTLTVTTTGSVTQINEINYGTII